MIKMMLDFFRKPDHNALLWRFKAEARMDLEKATQYREHYAAMEKMLRDRVARLEKEISSNIPSE